MIEVSAGTLEAQWARPRVAVFSVSYKLRYWDIDNQEFAHQVNWTMLRFEEVIGVTPSFESLDLSNLNVWTADNISITIKNRRNEWSAQNTGGRLKRDAVARLGYILYGSKVKVSKTFYSPGGVAGDPIQIFDGFVTDPINYYPTDNSIEISVESKHAILRDTSAENVRGSTVTDELIGTGDGSETEFTTAETGVARILDETLMVGGIPKILGIDWNVSDLNDPDLPALITFVDPVSNGEDIYGSYFTWKKNEQIHDLVLDLALAAGILEEDTNIEPVVFPNTVINFFRVDTKDEWEDGTLEDCDTFLIPGSLTHEILIDDFSAGSLDAKWTVIAETVTVESGRMKNNPGASAGRVRTPITHSYGRWTFELQQATGANATAIMNLGEWNGSVITNGYRFQRTNIVGEVNNLSMQRLGAAGAGEGSLHFANLTPTGSNQVVVITRESDGTWKVYYDGVLKQTIVDNTYSDFDTMELRTTAQIGYFDNVRTANLGFVYTSEVIDGGDDLVIWKRVDVSQTTPSGGVLVIETAVADEDPMDPGNPDVFDAWEETSDIGVIASAQKRFLKFRFTYTQSGFVADMFAAESAIVTYTGLSVTISLANFLGLSCEEAISQLAALSGYEWGIERDGTLSFNQRPTGDPDEDFILTNRHIKKIQRISSGEERVRNDITASYGNYEAHVDANTIGDTRPNSLDKYGFRPLSVSGGQILIETDANIAQGVALSYLQYFKNARRLTTIECQHLPQIEKGDIILVQYEDYTPERPWHIGDASVGLGTDEIHLWSEQEQALFGVKFRVVGVSNAPQEESTTFDLEEII